MTDSLAAPLRSPAAWRGRELQARNDWTHPLDQNTRDGLRRSLDRLASFQGPLAHLTRAHEPLDWLAPEILRWRRALRDERGFVLVRGVPVDDHPPEALGRLYWLLGCALGDPVPQNGAGDLLCDIRDTGADASDPDTRLYTTRAEQDFHTDGADLIGLLCLRTARAGGTSRIVSSVTVVQEFAARRPDLLPLLFEPWSFRLHGNLPPELPQAFEMPICRRQGEHLATFFIGWYLRRAQDLPGVPRWTEGHHQAIELLEQIANEPALYLDMDFQPGDIQWLKNSVILHKRTSYEDWAEPARKRHLLRLWLTARDFDDGDERLRRGIAPPAAEAHRREGP